MKVMLHITFLIMDRTKLNSFIFYFLSIQGSSLFKYIHFTSRDVKCLYGGRKKVAPHVIISVVILSCPSITLTVHFIYVCQRLFGDNFFHYLLFLTETFIRSTFFIQPETKFQLDPTNNEKFPHRPPL